MNKSTFPGRLRAGEKFYLKKEERDGYDHRWPVLLAGRLGDQPSRGDELDVHHLTKVARVNGEQWSRGSSATMTCQVEEIIAYISKGEGVQAGELIGSGTVGFGCGMGLGKLLKPGDVVELEVDGIGVLRNRVGAPAPAGWMPEHRTAATVLTP